MTDELIRLLYVAVLAAGCLVALEVLHRALRPIGRRVESVGELLRHAHRPAAMLAVLVGLGIGGRIFLPATGWRDGALHAVTLGLIGASAWFFAELLLVVEDAALSRYRIDVQDNRRARTVHTQVRLIRRVTVAVVALLALGAMLVTFPAARAVGASLLASAGLVGVVAALAAQSLLGNVLAGLQIAFGGSLRLDDVVIVENEWGRIQEITLTYVVVHIWDDRRLILPTSYFTTKPFQNWTLTSSDLIGTVELDVDWTVRVDDVRTRLRAVLTDSPLWDGRVSVLQVTEALGSSVRLRALVSARDAPTLWDLRCLVREELVAWLNEQHAAALPRVRATVSSSAVVADPRHGGRPGPNGAAPPDAAGPNGAAPPDAPGTHAAGPEHADAQVFGGGADGDRRAEAFSGPDGQPARP